MNLMENEFPSQEKTTDLQYLGSQGDLISVKPRSIQFKYQ